MWHAIWRHINQGDSQLLMVGRLGVKFVFWLLSLFSGHNLCCKYSNGSCEPILNIYISRTFQWYKEMFNPMSFDLPNHFLKIRDSIGTLTPKMGVHLGVCGFIPSHSFAFWECKCDSRVAFSTHTFPCPCLGCKPKDRVMVVVLLLLEFKNDL
jgi:hypothetical protein